uniref:Uncharacterized protein n=1 Tax=Anguilla anguilla TaxID=7936 RepID=A0A0E9S021_ANGAN
MPVCSYENAAHNYLPLRQDLRPKTFNMQYNI